MDIDYKYNEDELLKEIKEYIDKTYSGHYGQGGIQASEFIIDSGHGVGFFVGNIIKYAARYGKKGGHNKADIMKSIHYGIMLLHTHYLNVPKVEEDDLPF